MTESKSNSRAGSSRVGVWSLCTILLSLIFFLFGTNVGSVVADEGRRFLFIIDFSGSMAAEAVSKAAAREAMLAAIKRALEENESEVSVGVRIYGHRYGQNDRTKSCQDTELIVPFGGAIAERVIDPLRGLEARGFSPIAFALNQAMSDLKNPTSSDSVLLLSDGLDTCGGDPIAVLRRLKKAGVSVRVDTIGLQTSEKASQLLAQIAELTGGQFAEIKSLESLSGNLPGLIMPRLSGRPGARLQPQGSLGRGDLGSLQDAGNSRATALHITPGRHGGNHIGADGDVVDRFSFETHPGEKFSVHLFTKGVLAYRLRLLYVDEEGNSLVEGDLENDREVALDIFDSGTSEVAYLEVRASAGQNVEYDIELRPLVGF